ncbi:MAG: ABC transporter permease [Clostridiales bacterium]|nr:ABC transporter permease [Clostridiales bacterium]
MRGLSTLIYKENIAWWRTKKWMVNSVLWSILICGLMANLLFIPTIANMATETELNQAGGITAYVISIGLAALFEFGMAAIGIGVIILTSDSFVGEFENGICTWMLSKPVNRKSYVLSKLISNAMAIFILLIALPSTIAYLMLSYRMSEFFPLISFLKGVGIMSIHTLFYLTLTMVLGIFTKNRAIILAIALASALGGSIVGSIIPQLFHVTPWILPKLASIVVSGDVQSTGFGFGSLIMSSVWSIVFVVASLWKFEKMDL